jgi:hypothetical protein
MPKVSKKSKNPANQKTVNDEDSIREAVEELDEMLAEGRKPNITAVSKRHKIPYWTLYRRFLGRNKNASSPSSQPMTPLSVVNVAEPLRLHPRRAHHEP